MSNPDRPNFMVIDENGSISFEGDGPGRINYFYLPKYLVEIATEPVVVDETQWREYTVRDDKGNGSVYLEGSDKSLSAYVTRSTDQPDKWTWSVVRNGENWTYSEEEFDSRELAAKDCMQSKDSK
ncbi:hypothetical protein ACFL2V_16095 [Pseudomonadota bacterium]